MTNNPLDKYKRAARIYVELPSGKNYYPENILTYTPTGEIGIMAMTARDEIALKSPDALLNGDCIAQIIQSCVPACKNANALLAPDIEVILLGIFHASMGETLKLEAQCPSCNHANAFDINIRGVLMTAEKLEPPFVCKVHANGEPLHIHLHPYTHADSTKSSVTLFEGQKMLQVLSNEKLEDEEKLRRTTEIINKIAEFNFDLVVSCIEKIRTQDDVVTDREQIRDFVFNADLQTIKPIQDYIRDLNHRGTQKSYDAECTKCQHKWSARVEFNPASFFVYSSGMRQ